MNTLTHDESKRLEPEPILIEDPMWTGFKLGFVVGTINFVVVYALGRAIFNYWTGGE